MTLSPIQQRRFTAENQKSFYFQWHITSRCRGNCRFCYMLDSPRYREELKKELSTEECVGIIEKVSEYVKRNNLQGYTLLTGGDPLIKEGFWDILDALERENIRVIILGNPHLIDASTAKKLKEKGVIHYQLSIDGLKKTHDYLRGKGSFDLTWQAVKTLKKAGMSVSISYTISRINMDDIEGVLELCSNYGVDAFRPTRLVPEGRGKDFEKDLPTPREYHEVVLKTFRKFSELFHLNKSPYTIPTCDTLFRIPLVEKPNLVPMHVRIGLNMAKGCKEKLITILPEGTVYPCRRLPIKVGNIMQDSIEDLLANPLVEKLCNVQSFKECKGCKYLDLCRGGCPSVTYGVKKDPFLKDPQCWSDN